MTDQLSLRLEPERPVLPALPESTHYATTGRVAEVLTRVATVRAERERPWVPVRERLEVEDWTVLDRGDAS